MVVRFGTQGFTDKSWVGPFYPPGTPPRRWLATYAQAFDTAELDTTFYSIPRPAYIDRWRQETPEGFLFTAKVPRRITEEKRLVGVEEDLAAFTSVIERLGQKLGPLVVQLPPSLDVSEWPAVAAFLATLPQHLRWAVELRHPSWVRGDQRARTLALLREHQVAYVWNDWRYMPRLPELTTDFVYVRLVGWLERLESTGQVTEPKDRQLDFWARHIEEALARGARVLVYVNNHYEGFAPGTINRLRARLGLPPILFPAQRAAAPQGQVRRLL
jgi:uncharacterized protein YecE (DUF72 family)